MTGAGNTETFTVIRPVGKDRFGDPLPGTPQEFLLPGCLFAPGPSTEPGFLSQQVDTDGAVYAPPRSDVRPSDQMLVHGDLYQVVGKPQVWGSFGTVIALRLVTG